VPEDLHAVVVGGGITGLAAAWFIRGGDPRAKVTVVEADSRLGGKLQTEEMAGVAIDTGPDSLLARVPWAVDLCRSLGLADQLVAPATGRAFVWTRGRLRPLPRPLALGAPPDITALARSGIVSPVGVARAALDFVLPRGTRTEDPSVEQVIRERFGREVLERVVEPLLGGIHAGRAHRMSLASTAPEVAAAAAAGRSLFVSLKQARPRHREEPERPVFQGLAGGMVQLVGRLRDELGDSNIRVGTRAVSVEPENGPEGGLRVGCQPGPDLVADAVVLAVPAFVAAPILADAAPEAAAQVKGIDYASVTMATLGYAPDAVANRLEGSGFLVPRGEGRLMTACTWTTSKWPATRGGGMVLLRASTGRAGDERHCQMGDEELVDQLHRELVEAVGIERGRRPVATLVTRWPRSLPQYDVGHHARVERAGAHAAAALPGVVLAGAAYRGLGIAACVRDAQKAATAVLAVKTRRKRRV